MHSAQASTQMQELKLLNFRDFDVAGSYFNPPPPPKQQVDIYVTPDGQVQPFTDPTRKLQRLPLRIFHAEIHAALDECVCR